MNPWTQKSIDLACSDGYLDKLFDVYPMVPDGRREIFVADWNNVRTAFNQKDGKHLIELLLKFEIFPLKDSYVASFKRDSSSIAKNPETVRRLAERLFDLGLDEIYRLCSEPKETNRQIGPLFKKWVNRGALGLKSMDLDKFVRTDDDAVLDASDTEMKNFALTALKYTNDKGLDLVVRKNGKYVIGEAKFLTDFGGHQNSQFNDAMTTLRTKGVTAQIVAILDGVVYIKGGNKMYLGLKNSNDTEKIMSSLVLKEFINSL